MTLLSICQDAASEIGISEPSSVINNVQPEVVSLLRYAKKEGQELLKRGYWQALRTESTFTSLAQETQTSMIPSDYDRFVNGTFWNRTRKRPLIGPVTPQEWQTIKSWSSSPAQDTFVIRGNNVLVNPVPPAGETFAFEYISNKYCQSSGGTAQTAWAADTDTGRLPETLFTLGVVWRFLKDSGLPWDVAFQEYDRQVKQALMGDTARRVLNMSGGGGWMRPRPGVVVPEGDWSP